MVGQAQPISIETLLQKQKEEKEAASRVSPPESARFLPSGLTLTIHQPKFLTSAQRGELALAKRKQEEQDQREKAEHKRKDREALEREAEEFRARDRDRHRESRYGSSGARCQCLY